MKKNVLRLGVFFFALTSFTAMSQTKEDFKLITQLQDTLFYGYMNPLTIESKYDLSKILIDGKGVSISQKETAGKYTLAVQMGSSTPEITITITSSGISKTFIYPFRAVTMTAERAERIQN